MIDTNEMNREASTNMNLLHKGSNNRRSHQLFGNSSLTLLRIEDNLCRIKFLRVSCPTTSLQPLHVILVFWVSPIRNDFHVFFIPAGPAAIFGGTGSLTSNALRIKLDINFRKNLFENHVMLPTVAEVVFVQGTGLFVREEIGKFLFVGWEDVFAGLLFADFYLMKGSAAYTEHVEMGGVPAHSGLYGEMQFFEIEIGGNLDASPDHWFDSF